VDVNRQWLLIARWAEGIFGVCSFLYWLAFPWGPTHGFGAAIMWAYFLCSAVVAFVLTWSLRRGSRLAWYAAAVLCTLVLLTTVVSLPRWLALLHSPLPASTLLLPAISTFAQFVVALCLICTRDLRIAGRTQTEVAV
jgi:hypothetical protein